MNHQSLQNRDIRRRWPLFQIRNSIGKTIRTRVPLGFLEANAFTRKQLIQWGVEFERSLKIGHREGEWSEVMYNTEYNTYDRTQLMDGRPWMLSLSLCRNPLIIMYDGGWLGQRGSESVAVRRLSLTKPQGWQVSDYRVLYFDISPLPLHGYWQNGLLIAPRRLVGWLVRADGRNTDTASCP